MNSISGVLKMVIPPRLALLVCNERGERMHGQIQILPWKRFLRDLWAGKIIH